MLEAQSTSPRFDKAGRVVVLLGWGWDVGFLGRVVVRYWWMRGLLWCGGQRRLWFYLPGFLECLVEGGRWC